MDIIATELLSRLNMGGYYLDPDKMETRTVDLNFWLSAYMPTVNIIKLLCDIRESDNIACLTFEEAIIRSIKTGSVSVLLHKNITEFTRKDTAITFKLSNIGDLLESLIVKDFSGIKNVKIYLENYSVLYNGNITSMKKKEYVIGQETVTGLLLSDYNIPLVSTIYSELHITIDFYDNYEDSIAVMCNILQHKERDMIGSTSFELDMQPGRFVIFSGGVLGEHFTHDAGDLPTLYETGILREDLRILFDEAHQEADRRKNLKD